MVGSLFVRDVAKALREAEVERFHLVEVRLAAEYIVFDVLPPRGITGAGVERMRTLLLAMVVDERSALYAGEVGRAVDASAGVSALDEISHSPCAFMCPTYASPALAASLSTMLSSSSRRSTTCAASLNDEAADGARVHIFLGRRPVLLHPSTHPIGQPNSPGSVSTGSRSLS